jgi:GNAT superfamily N-acetyltransferase
MATPGDNVRAWRRESFLVSTDPALLDHAAINDAFESDLMWWSKRLTDSQMEKMIQSSLCMGLYVAGAEADGMLRLQRAFCDETYETSGRNALEMIGLARLITDFTTFGYLTDVYVLKEHQGKGLGRWMMECLNEVLDSWPDLRRVMLLTHTEEAARLYRKTLHMIEWSEGPSKELKIFEKRGGSVKTHH